MEKESTSFWADIKKYEDLLSKDSRSYCFAPLSELYRKLGLLDDAVAVAHRGIEAHPEYIGGFMALGRALYEQGNRDQAKFALEKVALATPENLLAQKILSQIYQEEGNLSAAERALHLLVTFNPEDRESALALEVLRRSIPPAAETVSLPATAPCAAEESLVAEQSEVDFTSNAEQPARCLEFDGSNPCVDDEFAEIPAAADEHFLATGEPFDAEAGIMPLATVTLAELYEGQGFLEKALQVYSDLLDKDPENQLLQERVSQLIVRRHTESGIGPVAAFSAKPELPTAVVRQDVLSGEDFTSQFPRELGQTDDVLDLLGRWLDAVRRRKECR
ncbi:MAG: tetratricopeptide repeat protein [Deltaproteobacteria bacterium]|nr:tetratricopeptide repeat protein [Deltaproteobacteria bacterium]